MLLLGLVLGALVIALIIIGQKLAQKMAAQQAATAASAHATNLRSQARPAPTSPEPLAAQVPIAQHYRSDTVGNDAAARPWDHGVAATDTPSAAPHASGWEQTKVSTLSFRPDQLPDRVPAHFDLAVLIERSKEAFMRLHTAWETADATALRDLLAPAIWQQVEPAIQAQVLSEWGQRVSEVQHLTARALNASTGDQGALQVRLEFTGSQWQIADAQTRPIHEVWDVHYCEHPPLWQIADLQARQQVTPG